MTAGGPIQRHHFCATFVGPTLLLPGELTAGCDVHELLESPIASAGKSSSFLGDPAMSKIFLGAFAGALLGMMVGWVLGRATLGFEEYGWNTKEQLLVWIYSAYGFAAGIPFGGLAGYFCWRTGAP